MRVIPALDIRQGACVQLVGGDFSVERVRLDDPVTVALDWERLGFSTLHVVDLDAASAHGSNNELIRAVISATGANVQVGGGVRDDAAVESLINAGASAIIVGTRALQDPEWLAQVSARYPHRIIVALDVRDGVPVIEAWRREAGVTFDQVMTNVGVLPVGGILLTAVHREGLLEGPDLPLVERAVRATPHPIIAAGGVSSIDDLRALEQAGASATVIGMALYTGAIDPKTLTEEFVS